MAFALLAEPLVSSIRGFPLAGGQNATARTRLNPLAPTPAQNGRAGPGLFGFWES